MSLSCLGLGDLLQMLDMGHYCVPYGPSKNGYKSFNNSGQYKIKKNFQTSTLSLQQSLFRCREAKMVVTGDNKLRKKIQDEKSQI
jgi:hypothetical protein